MTKKLVKDAAAASDGPVFNLLDEPWIPVLCRDGRAERVGIKTALTQAGKIRQIAATNPMDNVALLRFLLAVLLWCKPDAKEALAQLDPNADGAPEEWLGKLEQHKDSFDLFDGTNPFMQDIRVKDSKPNAATELIHDIPSGSALNHFLHCRDFKEGLCPTCCALGLVRWPSYATAGKKGRDLQMTASPNGNTPAYALPICDSLLQCLHTSLRDIVGRPDDPIWTSSARPTALGPISGLTWRSRTMLLTKPNENNGAGCAYCGSMNSGLVREIRFLPGWERLNDKPWEEDPQLVRITRQSKGKAEKKLIAHPNPNDPIDAAAMLWRDLEQGVEERVGTIRPDGIAYDVVVLGSNQALLKHVESIQVRTTIESSAKQLRAITKEIAYKLRGLVKATTVNKKSGNDEHPEVNAATVLLTAKAEAQVRAALKDPTALSDAKRLLRDVYEPVVEYVVDATATGSPLRRRAAKQHALALLRKKIDEIVDTANQPDAAAGGEASEKPAKAKRSRKKKESK